VAAWRVIGLGGEGRMAAAGARSDEELSKEYINSIMYAVPDVALMVPRTRPIKTYGILSV
jgi:hypothetical protein